MALAGKGQWRSRVILFQVVCTVRPLGSLLDAGLSGHPVTNPYGETEVLKS